MRDMDLPGGGDSASEAGRGMTAQAGRRPMKRLAILALVVLITLAATAVSAIVHRDLSHTNDFILLFALEPFVVLVGGIAASVYVAMRRDNARGVLGIGLYGLVSGTTFVTV